MLTIVGKAKRGYCDGLNRRSFLKVGSLGLGFGALTMADALRLEAANGVASSTKAIINVQLGGGPSHQDMWDLKPNAPAEYRGEFSPRQTNVPGVEICELMPQLAKMADKFSLIRGLVGSTDEHSNSTTQVGYNMREMRSIGGAPAIGSVVSKLLGYNGGAAPYVTAGAEVPPGYLGPKYKSFDANNVRRMLALQQISADDLTRRNEFLKSIDTMRRDLDASGQLDAADAFTQQAVEVVLSGKMAEALDVEKEKPENVARYVGNDRDRFRDNRNFLLARRLVEAGVRYVGMNWGGWDTHSDNFKTLREQLPALDQGLAALIQDLHERGLAKDVIIAVWGEFGRSPRISSGAGRDHWPRVAACFMAGGCVQGGRIVGESDRLAGEALNRPVHVHEVISTLYHNLGIDVSKPQLTDPTGRPRYLTEIRKPIAELL